MLFESTRPYVAISFNTRKEFISESTVYMSKKEYSIIRSPNEFGNFHKQYIHDSWILPENDFHSSNSVIQMLMGMLCQMFQILNFFFGYIASVQLFCFLPESY